MNSKTAKALRNIARDSMRPGEPISLLLAKEVKSPRYGHTRQAINANLSFRGRYRELVRMYEGGGAAREELEKLIAYSRLLRHEKKRGAQSFETLEERLARIAA